MSRYYRRSYRILPLALLVLVVLAGAPALPAIAYVSAVQPLTLSVALQGSYRVPITITERSGQTLDNYSVLIELNSTNFGGWSYVSPDGSDIYFTDADGTPLYYWIEYFNLTEKRALIWVKVPEIPASSSVTIYMYFGGTNPYTSYRDPNSVFLFFDDFSSGLDTSKWTALTGGWSVVDGYLTVTSDYGTAPGNNIYCSYYWQGESIAVRAKFIAGSNNVGFDVVYDPSTKTLENWFFSTYYDAAKHSYYNGAWNLVATLFTYTIDVGQEIYAELRLPAGELVVLNAGVSGKSAPVYSSGYIGIHASSSQSPFPKVDLFIVRKYVDPEPAVSIGSVEQVSNSVSDSKSSEIYCVPITITERSGQTLVNYTVRIELNETNFDGWNFFATGDGSDIYFLDAEGNPLYFWVEYFSLAERRAVIWVKVPRIPASARVTIYMYFGSATNPYASYNSKYDVFLLYDDFEGSSLDTSRWEVTLGSGDVVEVRDGRLHIATNDHENLPIVKSRIALPYNGSYYFEARVATYASSYEGRQWLFGLGNPSTSAGDWNGVPPTVAFQLYWSYDGIRAVVNDTLVGSQDGWSVNTYYTVVIIYTPTKQLFYRDGSLVAESRLVITGGELYVFFQKIGSDVNWHFYCDYVLVRAYADPEPLVSIGTTISGALLLPSGTVLVNHTVVYSPAATDFNYSFSAYNASYAGYNVSYPDDYGFFVWVDPASGAANNATLVATVTIQLPYGAAEVGSVRLLTKADATGSARSITVEVIDASGSVVASLSTSVSSTAWQELVLPVNTTLVESVTIRITLFVESTATAGEALYVDAVRVDVTASKDVPTRIVGWTPNVELFNVSASLNVELGSPSMVNASSITILVDARIQNVSVVYAQPYEVVGSVTAGARTYTRLYVPNATVQDTLEVVGYLPNVLKPARILVEGVELSYALVGEPIEIELPEVANVTLLELGKTFFNVTRLTLVFNSTGVYTISINRTVHHALSFGFVRRTIIVSLGVLGVRAVDVRGTAPTYASEDMEILLFTPTGELVDSCSGTLATFRGLRYGTYIVVAKVRGVVVGRYELSMTVLLNGSTVQVPTTVLGLGSDYRGSTRFVAWTYPHNLTVIAESNLSRVRYLVSGSGTFKLLIFYGGTKPSSVRVESNVSVSWYWDGPYLVIVGALHSTADVLVEDLYRLRVEARDALGNFLAQFQLSINGSTYASSVVDLLLPPATYVITVPDAINGFVFREWSDGVKSTTLTVELVQPYTAVAVYRVPTKFEGVEYRAIQLSWFAIPLSSTYTVEISGRLVDAYGNGVPGRTVLVQVVAPTGYSMNYTVATDADGRFRLLLDLSRDLEYRVRLSFAGDDVYVASSTELTLTPSEGVTPVGGLRPEAILAMAAVVVMIAALAGAAAGVLKKKAAMKRRFVRRRA